MNIPASAPGDGIFYACPFNKQRNSTTAEIFKRHLHGGIFPSANSTEFPPEHTIIIGADINSSSTGKGARKKQAVK